MAASTVALFLALSGSPALAGEDSLKNLEYKASRLTLGNLIFPNTLELGPKAVTFRKRGLVRTSETSFTYNKISTVSFSAGLFFGEVVLVVDDSDGTTFAVNQFPRRRAKRAKRQLEKRL
jgi:hypothetical protein